MYTRYKAILFILASVFAGLACAGNIQLTFPVQINGVNYNLLRPHSPQPQPPGPVPDYHPYPTYKRISPGQLDISSPSFFGIPQFSRCSSGSGGQLDSVRIESLAISPNPPIANGDTFITVVGHSSVAINQGIPIWDVGVDHPQTQLCTTDCPILPGPVTLTLTLPFFKHAPRLIKVIAKNSDGSQLFCLQGVFKVDMRASANEFGDGQLGPVHTQAEADAQMDLDRRIRERERRQLLEQAENAEVLGSNLETTRLETGKEEDVELWFEGLDASAGLDFEHGENGQSFDDDVI